jgi:hypothetical protein
MGPSQFIGSERFRDLIANRKKTYNVMRRNKEKDRIAREIFNFIRARGGKFLKRIEIDGVEVDGNVENGVWQEVDESVALEKCKQALRSQEKKRSSDATNLPPLGGSQVALNTNVDRFMLGADSVTMAMLRRHQVEKELFATRMLLQQRQQNVLDDAYLAAANASSSGSMLGRSSYSLLGGRPGPDPRMQALLQQRRQMEFGLFPPKGSCFASIPQRPDLDITRANYHDEARLGGPLKKRSIYQAPSVQAPQAPDPPVYPPSDPDDEGPVAEQGDDEVKEGDEPQCTNKRMSFPHKLYRMLEEAEKNDQEDVLSFSPDGRAFVIHQPSKFMEDIMPRYFKTTRMLSFQHQLHIYGFRRVAKGCDKGGYYHKFFLKGRKEFVAKITRNVSTGPTPTYCNEQLEGAVRAYQRAISGAGSGIRVPASQFVLQNSPRQQDLISQSLLMNVGGQRPGVENSLSGIPPTSAMDFMSDPNTSLESFAQGGNGSIRSSLAAARIGTAGLSGDPTTASLLRK